MMEGIRKFPITAVLAALGDALARGSAAVVTAPPGAGKTIGVPLALLDSEWLRGHKIIMLEPRRLAARRAAEYMSSLLRERVGETVGYRIRGDAVIGPHTRIEVVTEGILTRMLHAQADLPEIGLVIFDEFHERSLHADLGLALTLDVQRHLRDDLRVLVMSATLDGLAIAELLEGAAIIRGEEQSYPVETRYAHLDIDKPMESRVADVIGQILQTPGGDLLVFLPGMREIRRVEELLQDRIAEEVLICPLHGDLASNIQERALNPAPSGLRKVILATSIAETSLTIDGVRIVVDSGWARSARFDSRRGMSGLMTLPVSRATAEQRRGRAGRQAPGLCYRLWRESEHSRLADYALPEIRVSDLAHFALDLARWGSPDGDNLKFLDPPPRAALKQAQELLIRLGAMTTAKTLTPHGRAMSGLPLHPRLSHMILKAKEKKWVEAACAVAAILEERDFIPGAAKVDLSARMEMVQRGGGIPGAILQRIAAQKKRLLEMVNAPAGAVENPDYGVLLAWAYPERIGRQEPLRPGVYHLVNGAVASLPEGSELVCHEFLAIADIDAGATAGRIFLAAPLQRKDLRRTFAEEIETREEVFWDGRAQKVNARKIDLIGEMIIEESVLTADGEKVTAALVEGIRQSGLHVLPWERESEHLRHRMEWARKSLPALAHLPDCSEAGLLASLEEWLAPWLCGLSRLEQLQRLRLTDLLLGRLTETQKRELERLAPSHMQVPGGSRMAIDYRSEAAPVLAVKLQELFGLIATPRIGGGTVALTIHLLSPAARPLAVTQDLRSFWENTYPEIRKQLRARYPKHPWPENPLTAAPTRKTIRKR